MSLRHPKTNIDLLYQQVGAAKKEDSLKIAVISTTLLAVKSLIKEIGETHKYYVYVSSIDDLKGAKFDEVIEHYNMARDINRLNNIQSVIHRHLNSNSKIYFYSRNKELIQSTTLTNNYIKQ